MFEYPEISNYARAKLMQRAHAAFEAQHKLIEMGGPQAFMLAHSGYVDAGGQDVSQIQGGFVSDWHYPKGDRIDYTSGGQYFYHCHREDMTTEEHGHFHCYIRKNGWPKSWSLKQIPERAKYLDNPMTHLVTIGLNRYGMPVRLFMVNRWVTRESWFAADKMQRIVKQFSLSNVTNERPKTGDQSAKWQVMDAWVENMVHLFVPQIQWLHEQRDLRMQQLMAQHEQGANLYLDERFEELTSIDISLEKQIAWLTRQNIVSAA